MSEEIRALKPRAVWNKFADLNAVPRPSKREEKVIAFMQDFGKSLNLETITDKVGNVIIRKPATPGMENRKMVTLQSHLDMVHQKNSDTQFDFETEGIEMFLDGDWVRARGTTLGADNGMGVAAIMALLESEDIAHPPIEALFTIDEETGMTGAMGLEGGLLTGELLLNLDTEEDDEIDIGCAGGIDITATGTYKEVAIPTGKIALRISVGGLKGGHSGMDIHLGLGNANKIMNRLLSHLDKTLEIGLVEIDGGGLRNAIPRESVAVVVLDQDKQEAFLDKVEELGQEISEELSNKETEIQFTIDEVALPNSMMNQSAKQQLLKAVYAAHNGVYIMSSAIPGLVETSNNIARVEVGNGHLRILCLTRSSRESGKMELAENLKSVFELAGYNVEFSGSYPGWNPNPNSEILGVLRVEYESLFGEEPKVVACHAGLECGILGQNYPEMDMVSFGPTIKGAHSPDERVSVSSVQKFWKFLLAVLSKSPAKS